MYLNVSIHIKMRPIKFDQYIYNQILSNENKNI